MANNTKKKSNGVIIGSICVIIVLIAIIVVGVIMVNRNGGLSDAYFVSDNTKYVLTIETDEADIKSAKESGNTAPAKMHWVWTYDGDKVTGLKMYYEYTDEATAKDAYNKAKESGEDVSSIETIGKYVVITAAPKEYEGTSASEVKNRIEFFNNIKNNSTNTNTNTNANTSAGETVETNTEGNKTNN